MGKLLTDTMIADMAKPHKGIVIVRDKKVRGLGIRILPSGTRAFVLDYTADGRRRVYTIGKYPEWKIGPARIEATRLKNEIRGGLDPAESLRSRREAPTVAELCERFRRDHLPKLRPSTRADYERMMEKDVIPRLGSRKVADIRFADIDRLHRSITERGSPIAANFCVALCSKLFNYAAQLQMTDTNPVRGIQRNRVQPRSRYLSKDEIASLIKALNGYRDQNIADLFRLLLLTGARRGETRSAQWDQFNLTEGVWTKPSAHTKQNKEHRVPLAAPARQLLARRWEAVETESRKLKRQMAKAKGDQKKELDEWRRRVERFVFPAPDGSTGHVVDLKKHWAALCKAAGIMREEEQAEPATGKVRMIERHDARVHDLRHTAASVLASGGASLPLIGQLLGHTQVATTQRYAHLFDDAQRAAVERLGAVVTGRSSAKVIGFKGRRR